ncbi:MAG: tetratricopeptide repeat protein [Candidatus Omnitrophica bacterium]|nr:tetratricopeptide repeat protein [Candidatus Omnitrophota bacterium]
MKNTKESCAILIFLCFLVYANSLNGEFVSDDIEAIVKNPAIAQPRHYLFNPPMLLSSFCYLIGRLNPFAYHLINVILHAITSLLAFVFLRQLFQTETAFWGAAIFAVHPIHAEAVSWISGRGHLFFGFSVFLLYIVYQYSKKNHLYYIVSVLGFFYIAYKNLSLNIFFPFLLVLSDVLFGQWRNNWKRWVPFFAILVLVIIMGRVAVVERVNQVAKEIGLGGDVWRDISQWTNPIYNMTFSFFEHLKLIAWPDKLTLYHEPPVITRVALNWEMFFLGMIFISALVAFFLKKAKELIFALGIYLIFLSPTYSPIMVSWLVAERYAYFPSIAFSILLCFLYERYVKPKIYPQTVKLTTRDLEAYKIMQKRRKIASIMLTALLAMYSVRTVIRNEDWKTPRRLWGSTAEVSFNSPRAHNNMGDVYAKEGNMQGAINEFKKAIELKPDYADAYHNLANIYQYIGNLKEAIENYRQAIALNPGLFESHYNLGVIYLNTNNPKDLDLAIGHFQRALEIRPSDSQTLNALFIALTKRSKSGDSSPPM